MITTDIKQLAKNFDMADLDKRFFYKRINGYIVNAYAEEKKRVVIINAYFQDDSFNEKSAGLDKAVKDADSEGKVTSYYYADGELVFEFGFKPDIYFYMGKIIKEITLYLKENEVLGADYCWVCHKPLVKGDRQLVEWDSTVKTVHRECMHELTKNFKSTEPKRNLIYPSLGKGVTVSVISAILAAFMWAVLYSANFAPFIAGAAIGYTVKKMYDYGGGLEGAAKISVVPIANALSILLGCFMGIVPGYIGLVKSGAATLGIWSIYVSSLSDNRLQIALGFILSLAFCLDIFIKKGRSEFEQDKREFVRYIRSY